MKTSQLKAMNVVLIILGVLVILLGSLSMSMAAEKPKPGGIFIVGLHADPGSLNPAISSDSMLQMVANNIFSRLVYKDQKGNYIGDLAEKWTISDDNLTIRFILRTGAKWHDGRPVTAEDVKFGLEQLAKYHPRSLELRRASSFTVIDKYSLEIKFPTPSATIFAFLDGGGYIIPKHIYDTGEDLFRHPANRKPIGSGPFKFQEWRKGDYVALIKNTDYYIPGEPFVDKVVFKVISSGGSRVLALEAGDIDYLASRDLPTSAVRRLRKDPKFVVTSKGMGASSLNHLVFNLRRKPWDDVRVRRAIAHAIDRKVMAEKGTFGLAQPAYSHFSKRSWPWAYNPEVEEMYPHDLEKAGKLLDEAGYPLGPDGVRFKTTLLLIRGDSRSRDITAVLIEQLKKVGVIFLKQTMDKPALADRVWVKADFDITSIPSSQGSDPAIGIERFFVTKAQRPVPSPHNVNGYSKPEVDELFLQARTTMDMEERGQYYREVQLILMRDLPILPLTDTPKFAAFPKKVRGVNMKSFWAFFNAPGDVWFSE